MRSGSEQLPTGRLREFTQTLEAALRKKDGADSALISAWKRGKIYMVLTKLAHRFGRNTADALETIRMLRRWNVDIYFEQEDIYSLYESSEFMLTLNCAKASEKSHSNSQDIKWGLQKSFENPDFKYYQRKCYGYTHDADGRLEEKPHGAGRR